MLDFNRRPGIAERINTLVDAVLIAEREATPPRSYLGASRLGHGPVPYVVGYPRTGRSAPHLSPFEQQWR